MAWNNAVNANQTGVQTINAGVWTGSPLTQHSVLVGGASSAITSLTLTNGQILIGSTGVDPVPAAITSGTGILVANAAGSITVNATGGGLASVDVTGTTQAMAINTQYTANNAGLVTLTLPVTAAYGSIIVVTGKGAGGWTIAQNASQLIHFGSVVTTTGTGGALVAQNQFDSIRIECTVADTTWTVQGAPQGNILYV